MIIRNQPIILLFDILYINISSKCTDIRNQMIIGKLVEYLDFGFSNIRHSNLEYQKITPSSLFYEWIDQRTNIDTPRHDQAGSSLLSEYKCSQHNKLAI
jgi:hypothetical protein